MLIKRVISFIIICVICNNVTLAATSKITDKPVAGEAIETGSGNICACTAGYAEIVERLMPAVVSITATKKQKNKRQQQMPNYFSFKDLRDLMENLQPFLDNRMPNNNRSIFLFGSGFIIDASGIIVTNNHVIENADEITVKFHDDTTAQAKILGRDHLTDIAVLKVETRHALPWVRFGDSDKVLVGEKVLAIGNPIGLSGTVSAGIISARYRDIHAGPYYDDFLQTDASLNQGSSGSPLFNMSGEVIGINTAIYSTSGGGNIGIGFAIPSNSAASIVETLKTGNKVRRGYLGITVQEITDDIAQSLGDEELKGVLVSAVVKDSPAEKGGLKVGDIIREFNETAIVKVREFSKLVAYSQVGKKASLKVIRNNEPITLQVKVGELDIDKQQTVDGEEEVGVPENNDGAVSVLGLTVRTITSEVRRDHGLSDNVKGVIVINVEGGSYAELRGIRRYDVINQVNQRDIVNVDDMKRIISTATEQKRKSVLVRIVRNGQTVFIPIPLENKK